MGAAVERFSATLENPLYGKIMYINVNNLTLRQEVFKIEGERKSQDSFSQALDGMP